jgi:hypothetical protein
MTRAMESEFARAWAQLTERLTGPLMLRLILQPVVAATLAVRAGLSDARANRPAYLWTAISNRDARRSLVQSGWRDVGMVFVGACAVDAIYQLLEFGWFYPLQTLIVACALAIVPYLLVRGPVTRMARRRRACR